MESNIEIICRGKEEELLNKYFPKGSERVDSENIGEYTKDLPFKIEAEFRAFLEELWKQFSDIPLVLEEQKLRSLMTESDKEAVDAAYKKAVHISLWERISKSNHEDVSHYKALLYEYTKNLLMIMRLDFLEEITGKHITGKAFRE